MRAVVVAVVLLGCHDRAAPPPSSSRNPALRALADEVCTCKDAACRDSVRTRWQAATRDEPPRKDPTTMSQDEIAAELAETALRHDIGVRYLGCVEPDHGPVQTIARMTAYADRACACDRADATCVAAVKQEEDRYLQDAWPQQEGFTETDKQRLTEQLRRFQICVQHGP